METGVVNIQEPVSTKTNIEEAPTGVILDHSSMKFDKVHLSTVLDDEITSRDCGNNTIPGEADVVNGSGNGAKHSQEPEEEIGNISKARQEIQIKADEVKEEEDSRTVETSVNGTEAEHKATVPVEEISRNQTVLEEETTTDGESLDGVETTKRVLLEVKKEEEEAEMKTIEEPLIKTVVEYAKIVSNEETTAHKSKSLKENAEPVEAIKNSDDAEKISSEVTVDKEKEEVITQNTEEVQESVRVIETPTIQREDIESKVSLDHEEDIDKISKDTEEHEHVLVRDIPQGETVDTSTVQEAEILKTNINETEAHSSIEGEEEGQVTKENTKTSLDLKEDKEQEETEMVKTIISSDEVRSSDVQEEDTKSCSSEIKDDSHGREESVEVKTKETVQEESTEVHENLLDVQSTHEDEKSLVSNTENQEKFEETPSDLAVNVDKEELKDEKINVYQVDGTQTMEEHRGIDSNGAEAEQIDRNRTDETEKIPAAKLVALPDVETVEQMQKPSLESPSEVSEETSKTIDEKIEEKPEEETVTVPECKELGEEAHEERTLIDLTPLQEESCQPNEKEKETKLEKHETANEDVKSDEVIEVSSALPSKDLVGEAVIEAEKIENIKEDEEEQAAEKIQKSVETVESHSSLPSSLEEKEHGIVSEKIEDEKEEEELIVQIKSEDDTTKSHERQEEVSNVVEAKETTVVQVEQTRDIEPSLTEKCSVDQSQPEEQVKAACSKDEQKKEVSKNSENIVIETYAFHSAETAKNGESLDNVERVLEVEKEEEEAEMKTDAEPTLDVIEKEETEILKTVVEEAKIVNNEETTADESESLKVDDHHDETSESVETIKNSDDAEQNREMEEGITQKTEKIQESSSVIETPIIQGEDIESKVSLELKEEVDQSSKDIEEHEHVLERDIPQCETIEAGAVEAKEDTKLSLDKEDKEQEVKETAKTVILSDEVRPSDQVDVQAEEFGEHTKPCSSEIKDESHGREESVEVKSKETVQEESTEEKHENLLDVPSTESEKYQENEPEATIVANTESQEKFEEISSDFSINIDKEELQNEKINVEQRGLDSNGAEAEHIDRNRADETEESHVAKLIALLDVESVEQMQKSTVESLSEVSEETSKTIDEKIKEKSEEETVSVQESKELGGQAHEKRTLIDLTPLQEESFQPNEQEKEIVLEKHEPTNEDVSSESFKGENAESAKATENSDDAEKISGEVIGDREKEEDITQKSEEVQESPRVIETPRANVEEVDQSSKDTEDHEHVLGREIPECDQTLEAEAVDTSTVQEVAILETLETDINETEAVHSAMGGAEESQETEDDTEVKDESQGRGESIEVRSKETVQDETSEDKDVNLLDVRSGESKKFQEDESETTLVSKTESQEKSEETPLDLALKDELKDEKIKARQVDESQTMEVQRGLDLNEPEAEQIDQNRTDKTEESTVEKLVAVESCGVDETTHNQTLIDVESVEKVQKPSLEIPPEILEETSKIVDEKIEDKPKEEVTLHQEGEEEGSYALETKEETVSVPEESCLPNEQVNETKLLEKNEPTNEEVSNDQQSPAEETSDEVSSARPLEEREGETVVVAEKNENKEVSEEEKVAEKIQESLDTIETVEPHGTVCEKTDDEKVKEAEPTGNMREKGLEIAETTDLSLPSVDQKKDIKAFDEEIQIPSVAFPLDEQENVTSTEKEETKANETAKAKKGDEEITVSTSKTLENVCIQQEEFGKFEAPKLEESKEDKSLDIAETIKAIEATSDQTLPIETSDADNTPSSELVSEEKDQTPKQVEEIHEEETEEAHKLQAEEIIPTEIIPRESSDEALVSMLASKEDEQVMPQENKCADDVRETKDMQQELPISVESEETVEEEKAKKPRDEHVETPALPIILEKNDNETLVAEAKKGDEDINETEKTVALVTSGTSATLENVCIKQEELANQEAPKLEESKEDKSLDIAETIKAIEATSDQTLPIETSDADNTPSSELVSEEKDQTPKQVEEIHEEETKETHKVQAEDTVPRESFSEAPVPMLASGEDEPVTLQEGNYAVDDTQEKRHVSAEAEKKVGETKPKEPEAEETKKSDDQVETSTKLTDVEEENTKKKDNEVAELTDYSTVEAEYEDENSSNLPVVKILKGLHNTLEIERTINDSASLGENVIKEPADQEQKKGDAEVESNEKDCASDIIEELNLQEEHKEEVKVQDDISREFEVNVEEKLQEETREIAECNEAVPADLSFTEVLPVVKILIPSSPLTSEEVEHVISAEKQEEGELQQDVNASISEKISLLEEYPRDFETSKMEQKKEETHETVKEEDQIVDNKEAKKSEEEQDEKLWDSYATRDIEEIFSSEVKDDKEVHSVLGSEEEINEVVISEKQITDPVGVIRKASEAEHEPNEENIETQAILDDTKSNDDRDFTTEQAPKYQRDEVSADKSLTKEALNEQIQVPFSALLDDQDLSVKKPSELIQTHQSPNQVEETSFEVKKAEEDKNEETGDALIIKENVQVKPKDFEASAEDKETSEQKQKSNDLKDLQENIFTNVKLEVHDDEVRRDSHDSVVEPKEETGLIEEKKEVEHVKTELEDAIKHGVSVEETNNTTENIDRETTEEICQEESKQIDTVTAINEEIREEEELSVGSKEMPTEKKIEETKFLQKETTEECFNNMKNTDDGTEKTKLKIENLSSARDTQDKQKDEVPKQQTREIADEVPKMETPKIAEELQKKDGESENKRDLFSEVKESEPTEKESKRKLLSDLIQNVKGTNKNIDETTETKIEDATTEPHIEEASKTEEDENEEGDHEHDKDDKTSPDSLVMVEAKDTVSIIKTHKKSQGILSGVGSKVKHSISKVKKVLTGKSSHTTKPSSPK